MHTVLYKRKLKIQNIKMFKIPLPMVCVVVLGVFLKCLTLCLSIILTSGYRIAETLLIVIVLGAMTLVLEPMSDGSLRCATYAKYTAIMVL